MNKIKRIVVTPGEPAGIGPDILIQLAQRQLPAEIVAIADPEVLQTRAERLNLPLQIIAFDKQATAVISDPGSLKVLPVKAANPYCCGTPDVANASYLLETLKIAVRECIAGTFMAMVTGPINKSVINEAGYTFTGHTEYLAQLTNTKRVVMMLATEGLRVALATTHLPLAKVPAAINKTMLREILTILQQQLVKYFNCPQPKILVAGLNPHAGESGNLGREELDVIIPVLNDLRKQQFDLLGPLPADTLFSAKYLTTADAVLAMYHDQGLPVLKYKGFGQAVNITLGLPIIRTSVDHGTAFDLAGSGRAQSSSLLLAINVAMSMIEHKKESS